MLSFKEFLKEINQDSVETIDEAKMTPTQKLKRDIYLKTKLAPKLQKYISLFGKAKARSKMIQDANKYAIKPLGEQDIFEEDWDLINDEEFDFLVESFEELNELSKSTLTSYARKASDQGVKLRNSAAASDRESKGHFRSMLRAHSTGDRENASHHNEISRAHQKDFDAAHKKSEKRLAGAKKAFTKLAKEEVEKLDKKDSWKSDHKTPPRTLVFKNAKGVDKKNESELAKEIASYILETIITNNKLTKEDFDLFVDDLSSIMIKGE